MKRVRKTLKNYFVPHEENEHKPHILRARTVAIVLVFAFAIEGVFVFGTSYLVPNSRLFGIILVNSLIDETNQSRISNNVPVLTINPLLMAAAQDKANDMVLNNYFAHTSPSGLTPWYWFQQVGYNYVYAGENLAVNFSDSQDVTNAWMNSPEHRANILNPNFTEIGMADATGTYNGQPAVYVVELFGDPALAAPPAEAPLALIQAAGAEGNPPVVTTSTAIGTSTAPKRPVALAPTVVASSSSETSSSNETFIAVQNTSTATSTTSATVSPESNPIQNAAANPRQAVDYLYLFIIALFAVALCINIFVKIRIQHAQLIFGGMLVIIVAGLFIVLNFHMLAGAAIL